MTIDTKQTDKAFFLFEYIWDDDNRTVSQGRKAELLQSDQQALRAVRRLAAGGHAWAQDFLRTRDRYGEAARAYLHLVPIAEPDYRAALRAQEQYLSSAVIGERWRRFCRDNSIDADEVMLPLDWKQAWRWLVEEERRSLELWKTRRQKTLCLMQKAKAAEEAVLASALTPEQLHAEREARKSIIWAELDERDKRSAIGKLIIEQAPELKRQEAQAAVRLAEAKVKRLNANLARTVGEHLQEAHKRLGEDRRRREYNRQRAELSLGGDPPYQPRTGSWVAEREQAEKAQRADIEWLRSIGPKARKIELEKRKAAALVAHDEQRAQSDRVMALRERLEKRRRARMAAGAAEASMIMEPD
jgi:hypothetical protein